MEQESIEDYLKLNLDTENPIKDEVRIRSIITTAQKKKECEDRAIRIVELLIEGTLKSEIFLKSIGYLNTSYYQDIVEERAITRICGYPLCGKRIQPIPNRRYSISTKNNEVYDLNEYGFFCSMYCYNASNHIKQQIDNSPLWLREVEYISTFNLLPKDKGHTGTGVDIKIRENIVKGNFTPVASFAAMSLDDIISSEEKKTTDDRKQCKLPTVVEDSEENIEIKRTVCKKSKKIAKSKLETVTEDVIQDNRSVIPVRNISEIKNGTENKDTSNTNLSKASKEFEATLKISRKESEISKELKILNDKIKMKILKSNIKLVEPIPLKNEKSTVDSYSTFDKSQFSLKNSHEIELIIRETFKRWISFDTLLFVHGENKVKEIMSKKKLIEYFDQLKVTQLEISQQKKYVDICKKLQMQEILEENEDDETHKLRLLPKYSELKKSMKEMDIKVKTFYSGLQCETEDSNFPHKEKDNEEGIPPNLPLADANSQNELRRRVLFNSLSKGMKLFLDQVDLKCEPPFVELKELLKTFTLTADNVVFKPIMWKYLGFICLKILALRNNSLNQKVTSLKSVQLENLMFEPFSGKKSVISDTLDLIKEVDNFPSHFLSQVK